ALDPGDVELEGEGAVRGLLDVARAAEHGGTVGRVLGERHLVAVELERGALEGLDPLVGQHGASGRWPPGALPVSTGARGRSRRRPHGRRTSAAARSVLCLQTAAAGRAAGPRGGSNWSRKAPMFAGLGLTRRCWCSRCNASSHSALTLLPSRVRS